MKKLSAILISVFSSIVFILALFIIIFGTVAYKNHEMINLFGYSYSVVPTPSMVDAGINVNDVVISKKVDYFSLKEHDIVIYYSELNKFFIVHEIIGGNAEDGFIVKGTNNSVSDPERVTIDNFQTKMVKNFSLGVIGKIASNNKSVIFIVIIFLFIIIVINELINIVKAKAQYDEERKKKEFEEKKNRLREEIMKEIEASKKGCM